MSINWKQNFGQLGVISLENSHRGYLFICLFSFFLELGVFQDTATEIVNSLPCYQYTVRCLTQGIAQRIHLNIVT